MSPSDEIEVKIAGASIRVPMYHDAAKTSRIIDMVKGALEEIEAQSTRIDTQAFALSAAVQFATQLQRERDDRTAEHHALIKELDRIKTLLQELSDPVTQDHAED